MKERILCVLVVAMAFVLITACVGGDLVAVESPAILETLEDTDYVDEPIDIDVRSFEIGSVRLISNGMEYEPHDTYTVHSAFFSGDYLVSASGTPSPFWSNEALETMPIIQYADDLQFVIDGDDGELVNDGFWAPTASPGGMRLTQIVGSLSNGMVEVSLPNVPGVYLLYADVVWSADCEEFVRHRYVFKIER